jgi:hypothetical protein
MRLPWEFSPLEDGIHLTEGMSSEIADRDIAERKIFESVVLDPFETRFAMEGLDDGIGAV